MAQRNDYHEDDYFSDTRMSFGDHLEDLRTHLWRAAKGFGLCLILGFLLDGLGSLGLPIGFGRPILVVIAKPIEKALQEFYDRRVQQVERDLKEGKNADLQEDNKARDMELDVDLLALAKMLNIKPPEDLEKEPYVKLPVRIRPVDLAVRLNPAQRHVGKRPALTTLSVQEAFMVYLKVSIYGGIVVSSPWVFWQVWSFIGAGLYPHEKRLVNVYLPFSLFLFLAGVLVCQIFVMPKAVEVLLSFNEWIGIEPDLRLNEWLGFAILTPLVFGISFQTPLVMMMLERVGVFTIETFREKRNIAWFIMAIFSAVITPTVDPFSMLLMWVPMGLLYELGIYMIYLSPRRRLDVDVPESEPEEMVEV